MDEIGLAGKSAFAFVENAERISEGEIDPEAYGFKLAPKEAIQGGDATFNAQITRDILQVKSRVQKGISLYLTQLLLSLPMAEWKI